MILVRIVKTTPELISWILPHKGDDQYLIGTSSKYDSEVEMLPVPVRWGRGWMGESTRQVEGLFESLLAEAFEA
jgi:hypothetical protein